MANDDGTFTEDRGYGRFISWNFGVTFEESDFQLLVKDFPFIDFVAKNPSKRELSYSSLRFGLYEPIRDKFAEMGPSNSSAYRMTTRIVSGCSAGGLAAVIACPFELLKGTWSLIKFKPSLF